MKICVSKLFIGYYVLISVFFFFLWSKILNGFLLLLLHLLFLAFGIVSLGSFVGKLNSEENKLFVLIQILSKITLEKENERRERIKPI